MAASNVGFGVAGAVVIGGNGDSDLAYHRCHFGAGLPQGLSGFRTDLVRQFFLVLLQQRAKFFHQGLALTERALAPVDKR